MRWSRRRHRVMGDGESRLQGVVPFSTTKASLIASAGNLRGFRLLNLHIVGFSTMSLTVAARPAPSASDNAVVLQEQGAGFVGGVVGGLQSRRHAARSLGAIARARINAEGFWWMAATATNQCPSFR